MRKISRFSLAALLWAGALAPVGAFDGWFIESAVAIPGEGSSWDYLSLDEARNRLFIGHRGEGLMSLICARRS